MKADDQVTFQGVSYSVTEFAKLMDIAARVCAMRGTPYYAKAIKMLERKAAGK